MKVLKKINIELNRKCDAVDCKIGNQSDVQTVYEKRCDGTHKFKDEVISISKIMTIIRWKNIEEDMNVVFDEIPGTIQWNDHMW